MSYITFCDLIVFYGEDLLAPEQSQIWGPPLVGSKSRGCSLGVATGYGLNDRDAGV